MKQLDHHWTTEKVPDQNWRESNEEKEWTFKEKEALNPWLSLLSSSSTTMTVVVEEELLSFQGHDLHGGNAGDLGIHAILFEFQAKQKQ